MAARIGFRRLLAGSNTPISICGNVCSLEFMETPGGVVPILDDYTVAYASDLVPRYGGFDVAPFINNATYHATRTHAEGVMWGMAHRFGWRRSRVREWRSHLVPPMRDTNEARRFLLLHKVHIREHTNTYKGMSGRGRAGFERLLDNAEILKGGE